jgi:pimeloyl-ACP methyl ester carboxylesterase
MMREIDWLVIPGGPGLSSTYLKTGLAEAFAGCKVHFYDPLGAPELSVEDVPTIDNMVDQIFSVIKELNVPRCGFITHSFGNYLAMRALEKAQQDISGLIMISPMPFSSGNWRTSLQKIAEKVPASVFTDIQALSAAKDSGSKIFKAFFPYYAVQSVELPDIPFDSQMCDKISAQVGEYDERELVTSLGIPVACIVGEVDPFLLEKELLENKIVTVPGVGHYPFLENPEEFSKAVTNVEDILCQRKIASSSSL